MSFVTLSGSSRKGSRTKTSRFILGIQSFCQLGTYLSVANAWRQIQGWPWGAFGRRGCAMRKFANAKSGTASREANVPAGLVSVSLLTALVLVGCVSSSTAKPADGNYETLLFRLEDPHSSVRLNAAVELRESRNCPATLIPRIISMLADEFPLVREESARILGQCVPKILLAVSLGNLRGHTCKRQYC